MVGRYHLWWLFEARAAYDAWFGLYTWELRSIAIDTLWYVGDYDDDYDSGSDNDNDNDYDTDSGSETA